MFTMDNPASILPQLLNSQSAGMVREITCWKRRYTLVLPSGARITASGVNHFCFQDDHGTPVLDIKYNQACCGLPDMQVRLQNSPTLNLRMKGWFSRSTLVFNENDVPVLRVRRPVWILATCEYKILGENNIQIGRIQKDWLEYDVHYPADLDVRYKACLLASCIFMDFLNGNRNRRRW